MTIVYSLSGWVAGSGRTIFPALWLPHTLLACLVLVYGLFVRLGHPLPTAEIEALLPRWQGMTCRV